MFIKILYNIENTLKSLPSREEMLKSVLKKKLDDSTKSYKEYLQKEREYLLSRSNQKVVNNIERERKRQERRELNEK